MVKVIVENVVTCFFYETQCTKLLYDCAGIAKFDHN